jgi:hypothetical protein
MRTGADEGDHWAGIPDQAQFPLENIINSY